MKIYDIAKCTSGNVLGIGVDKTISNILNNNSRVLICNLLNSEIESINKKGKKQKEKKLRIKKIRKKFKYKNVDFIICNVKEIQKYLKTFVSDNIYINKNITYIYNIIDEEQKEEIIKKYKRYNTKIEEIQDEKSIILKIDNREAKTNIIKDFTYKIIDTLSSMLNIVSDILIN